MCDTVFVDTSIQIARFIHSPLARQRIEERLQAATFTLTGLIVRQEFKRRFLKDARYLLDLFRRYDSFAEVQRHVVDVLTPFQKRKQKISLQLLTTLLEDESDEDKTDRAKLLLAGLLRDGLDEFDESVGHVVRDSNCKCATQNILLNKNKYDFGDEKCSRTKGCGIAEFLYARREVLQEILSRLENLPEGKITNELTNAMEFIRAYLKNPDGIRNSDPCLKVGDLLIALESGDVPCFFTMNGKESQHLCRALGQKLVVRPSNAENDDITCETGNESWPEF